MKQTMRDKLVSLMKRRYVTPLDALEHAQCLSLSQRAGDLRRAGIKVLDKWIELPNGKRVKGYRIA